MELTQLHYFTVVAECEHFHKASELLHITQPTLSQSISKLEAELGCKLFERSGRNVYLSPYGKAFYKSIKPSMMQIQSGIDSVRNMVQGERGDVRVGITVPELITSHLNQFIIEYPDIHIRQHQGTSKQLSEMLTKREIDMAICIKPIISEIIHWETIYTETLGIIVSKNHHLASQKEVRFADLGNEFFVVNNSTQDLSDIFIDHCSQAGISPKIIFEGDQTDLIATLIHQGRGISMISMNRWEYHKRKSPQDNIHFLKISDINCTRTIGFAVRRDCPVFPAAEVFYKYLKNALLQQNVTI